MRLNWGVVRQVLESVEQKDVGMEFVKPDEIDPSDPQTVAEHMRLLHGAGLIEAAVFDKPNCDFFIMASRLTLPGYELLGRIRSKKIWESVTRQAREFGVELTVEVVKELAVRALRGAAGS